MRRPTPLADQLAWHREALHGAGKIVAAALEPQVGWYKRKLVSGGIHVPARIWIDQPVDDDGLLIANEILCCEVNGEICNPFDAWPWIWNQPISEAEFNYMTAQREWAKEHWPSDPAANPRQRLSALTSPIRF
jgi:hypothetical protein